MTIEIKEKGTREFYKEVVNVLSQYRQLLKNPEAKLKDNFRSFSMMMILMAVLCAMELLIGFSRGFDGLTGAAVAVTFIVLVLLFYYRKSMNNMVEAYLNDDRTSIVTLDENGVEINKGGSQVIRIAWDDVAMVRTFEEATCFFSKDVNGLVLSVINTYKQEIFSYLSDKNINVKIIK